MTTPAEFLIPVRVVVGKKTIIQKAKLVYETATVKSIIDGVLPAAAERADGNIIFESAEAGDRYVRYTPSRTGSLEFSGRPPLVFCFLFSPPAHYP